MNLIFFLFLLGRLEKGKPSQADMALWNGIGQVANLAQLTGVDAHGLISMIVEAAKTVKRNRETCQLLARRVRMIGALLQQLQSSQLMQHTETRIPMEELEETLQHAYVIIASCGESSYLHRCFTGAKQAEMLREVQNEITFYLQLFPLVSFVDITRNLEHFRNADHPSRSEVVATDGSECDDRLRDIDVIKFNPQEKSGNKLAEGQAMDIEELANLTGDGKGTMLSCFSLSQILAATEDFSTRNLIDSGGFGHIYKGKLSNGLDIGVKRHSESSLQGEDEFTTEIKVIPNLRNKNIITLLGYCKQGREKILVYEYMPNRSLASIISDGRKRKLLKWCKRIHIIKAVADGLAYLHGHSHMCIVHRDIKPSNILLDHEMNAKISDFALALLAPDTFEDVEPEGTYGYAAPEYFNFGYISDKVDVYGFGVVLLQIISGRPVWLDGTSRRVHISEYARWHRKRALKIVDPLLLDAKVHERAQIKECIKVALLCTDGHPENRPAMSEIVTMVDRIKAL